MSENENNKDQEIKDKEIEDKEIEIKETEKSEEDNLMIEIDHDALEQITIKSESEQPPNDLETEKEPVIVDSIEDLPGEVALNADDILDIPEIPELTEIPVPPEILKIPEIPEVPQVPDTINMESDMKVSEVPEVPEVQEILEVPTVMENNIKGKSTEVPIIKQEIKREVQLESATQRKESGKIEEPKKPEISEPVLEINKPQKATDSIPRPFLSDIPPQEIINSVMKDKQRITKVQTAQQKTAPEENFDTVYNKALIYIKENKNEDALQQLNYCLEKFLAPEDERKRKLASDRILEIYRRQAKIKYEEGLILYKKKNYREAISLWNISKKLYEQGNLPAKGLEVQKVIEKIAKQFNIPLDAESEKESRIELETKILSDSRVGTSTTQYKQYDLRPETSPGVKEELELSLEPEVIERPATEITPNSISEQKTKQNETPKEPEQIIYCPHCKNQLQYNPSFGRYYCSTCKKYIRID